MEHDLKDLFARELAGEPPPPAGVVAAAMTHGTRLRRRRDMRVVGGTMLGLAAVLAFVVPASVDAHRQPTPLAVPAIGSVDARCRPTDAHADRARAAVFLSQGITTIQHNELEQALRGDPLLRSVTYESQALAYERFVSLWRDSPDLVAAVKPDQLPESFRIELKDPATYGAFVTRFAKRPGVEQITQEIAVADARCRFGAKTGMPSGGR